MNDNFLRDTSNSYDTVASDYAQRYQNELSYKPFDRKMLDLFIERTSNKGQLCDMGCGPGQIASYLHESGADVVGVDLSSKMVAEAQNLYPEIQFQQGNMLNLNDIATATFAGVTAFYCIIHIPRQQISIALQELQRILKLAGTLLLTFHIGDETRHLDTWFDRDVNVDFRFFNIDEMQVFLRDAGFEVQEIIQRNPYPDEAQTQRAYIFARKPS